MRVFGWQTLMQNESKLDEIFVRSAPLTGLEDLFLIVPSKSMYAGTRKMVNYT